jgi:hypothetical protein
MKIRIVLDIDVFRDMPGYIAPGMLAEGALGPAIMQRADFIMACDGRTVDIVKDRIGFMPRTVDMKASPVLQPGEIDLLLVR